MKSKKILLILLIAVMLIASNMKFVYADSFSVTMTSDKKNYAAGQIVKVTVALANINSSEGIYGLVGKLVYDENIFEPIIANDSGIVTSKVDGENKDIRAVDIDRWGGVTYNSNSGIHNGEFSISTLEPVKSGTVDLMIIQLKVKEGAKLGGTTIQIVAPKDDSGNELPGISASNGDDDLFTTPVAIGVNIMDASALVGEEIPPVEEPTPSPLPSPSAAPVSPSPKPIVTPSASTSGKLPQTGLSNWIVPVIGGAVIISLVAFVAYRKYKDI